MSRPSDQLPLCPNPPERFAFGALIVELCRSARLRLTCRWGHSFLCFAPCPSAHLHVCATPPERFAFGARVLELCRSAPRKNQFCRSGRLRLKCVCDHSFFRFAPCLSAQLHICTTPPERFAFEAQICELCRSAQLIFELCRSAPLRMGPLILAFCTVPFCSTPRLQNST